MVYPGPYLLLSSLGDSVSNVPLARLTARLLFGPCVLLRLSDVSGAGCSRFVVCLRFRGLGVSGAMGLVVLRSCGDRTERVVFVAFRFALPNQSIYPFLALIRRRSSQPFHVVASVVCCVWFMSESLMSGDSGLVGIDELR